MGSSASSSKSWLASLLAVALGVLLTLALFEGGLTAAAWVLKPTTAPASGAQYVIVAEGDSFTYGVGGRSFPAQLEALLNARAGAPLFQVVNRGEPGINTTQVAERVPEHLDEHQPDLVIVTIGENNSWNTHGSRADLPLRARLDMMLSRSRTYRFFKVWLVGWDRPTFHEGSPTIRELGDLSALPEGSEFVGMAQEEAWIRGERETEGPFALDDAAMATLDRAFELRDAGAFEASIELFEQVIAAEPGEMASYVGAAGSLMRLDRNEDAIALIERGRAALPEGAALPDYARHSLHYAQRRAGQIEAAIATLVEALRDDPRSPEAMHALALLHYETDGHAWRALDDVAQVPGIEANELYGYLERLAGMTEGQPDRLADLVSEGFTRDMRVIAHAAHERGVKSIWTSYPLHAYPEVAGVAAELGIPYIDFRPHFAARFTDPSEFLAADGCHCNTDGYQLMAELLADMVLEALGLELPAN